MEGHENSILPRGIKINFSNTQGQPTLQSMRQSGQKSELIQDMVVLATAKNEDQIKQRTNGPVNAIPINMFEILV